MLLDSNLADSKLCKNLIKLLKPWHMGTHLRVLPKGFPTNTNMIRFRFLTIIISCALDKSSLSIGRVQEFPWLFQGPQSTKRAISVIRLKRGNYTHTMALNTLFVRTKPTPALLRHYANPASITWSPSTTRNKTITSSLSRKYYWMQFH